MCLQVFNIDNACNNAANQIASISFFKCCLINARSICNKLLELQHLLNSCDIDILLITETWLTDAFSSSLLIDLSLFSVLRKDRHTTGGGVCAIIRLGTDFVNADVPSKFETLELLVFDVLCVHTTYRFIFCYRTRSFDTNELSLLTEAVDLFCITDASIVLCGDFNLPQINWTNVESASDSLSTQFIDCIQANA
jgi:hypothetical protein